MPPKQLLIPYQSFKDDTFRLFVGSEELDVVQLYNELNALPIEDSIQFIQENEAQLFQEISISGIISQRMPIHTMSSSEIRDNYPTLHEDFYLLEEGKEPNITLALILFLSGIAIIACCIFIAVAKTRKNESELIQ